MCPIIHVSLSNFPRRFLRFYEAGFLRSINHRSRIIFSERNRGNLSWDTGWTWDILHRASVIHARSRSSFRIFRFFSLFFFLLRIGNRKATKFRAEVRYIARQWKLRTTGNSAPAFPRFFPKLCSFLENAVYKSARALFVNQFSLDTAWGNAEAWIPLETWAQETSIEIQIKILYVVVNNDIYKFVHVWNLNTKN